MKYTVNEKVIACCTFGLYNAVVLASRVEKQPAGNNAHIYTLSLLGSDGSELMQLDMDECSILPDTKKEDASRTHRELRPLLKKLSSLTEDVFFVQSKMGQVKSEMEEIDLDPDLDSAQADEEKEGLRPILFTHAANAAIAEDDVSKVKDAIWSILTRYLTSYIQVGHSFSPEILADMVHFDTLCQLTGSYAEGLTDGNYVIRKPSAKPRKKARTYIAPTTLRISA